MYLSGQFLLKSNVRVMLERAWRSSVSVLSRDRVSRQCTAGTGTRRLSRADPDDIDSVKTLT